MNTFGDSDLEEDEVNEEPVKAHNEDESGIFYSWECISFVKKNGTTLDLVIPSSPDLLALIHIVHKHVHRETDNKFLYIYKLLKFKMKLAYESWIKRISLGELIQRAVFKTLVQ